MGTLVCLNTFFAEDFKAVRVCAEKLILFLSMSGAFFLNFVLKLMSAAAHKGSTRINLIYINSQIVQSYHVCYSRVISCQWTWRGLISNG